MDTSFPMVTRHVRALLSDQALHPEELVSSLPGTGAVVTFIGQVRDVDHARPVKALSYSAHPSAAAVLEEVAQEVADGSGASVLSVVVAHRVGELAVGEVALVAVVAAPHRREAFELCGHLVEEVKRRLPVWKLQRFADGSEEWVNAC